MIYISITEYKIKKLNPMVSEEYHFTKSIVSGVKSGIRKVESKKGYIVGCYY
jgi:hypothetical protein